MNKFIDINNRDQMKQAFAALRADSKPLWGNMAAQQMAEHMIDQVEYTNGKKTPTLDVPAEEAAKSKKLWIYTDIEIPRNIFLKVLPTEYDYTNLGIAIQQLFKELEAFDKYFETPGRQVIHGGFGPMNYQEWQVWHGKHFTHHLKQFGLI